VDRLNEVSLPTQELTRYRKVVGQARVTEVRKLASAAQAHLAGGAVWHINSTAVGGGVAEMLPPLIGYCRDLGIDARWLVINGPEEFFRVTKRLHHALHGEPGDGSALDEQARRIYEKTLQTNLSEVMALVQPGDFVILHDPQTLGLAPALAEHGARLIWRCHIGRSESCDETDAAWEFLAPYLQAIPRYIFSRREYVPNHLDHGKSVILAPSIDAFTPKNQPMAAANVRAILMHTGLLAGTPGDRSRLGFKRADGGPGRVDRFVDVVRCGPPPGPDIPLVVQVSRWDTLKDPVGVLHGFARWHTQRRGSRAELVLAGPSVKAVADDPEGPAVFAEVFAAWCALPHEQRSRVHLAMLPMVDVDENGAIVNALQRHARVVVQKSLREGFGLTLTEAMWKRRAVIASRIGGLQDQIEHAHNGLLLDDPREPLEFVAALNELLDDELHCRRLGDAAGETVKEHYLAIRSLRDHLQLILDVVSAED
jgi:trehalose synthase